MGNYSGTGVQNSRSVSSYTIPSASYTQPEKGRVNILPCNFYRNQCQVLEEQLSVAESILIKETWSHDVVSSSGELFWPQLALTELRRLLKVGETLIEGCHDQPCLKAYLRQGERTLAFSEILKEIVWCMSVVLYYNSKRCLPGDPSMAMDEFPLARLGAYKELYMLQTAAVADQKELLTSLDIWIQNHLCSANECGGPQWQAEDPPLCIAAQILRRRGEAGRNGNAGIEVSSEVDHTSVLWNINNKTLKDGKFIGAGGVCSVIETTWLGDTYAKKNFRMDSPELFSNEANALSKLSHPHMVTVSAYSVDSQTCSLLMERMPHDLRQYMTKRQEDGIDPPFSIMAVIDLMLQVAEAMRYMHSEGMVHRDLKPANILVQPVDDPGLCKEGFVVAKLADFGLAKLKNEVTNYSHLTKNQGTRRYMAPEVFEADADDDEHLLVAFPRKVDVYSFGIVCFEILTGMIPFPNVRMSEFYSLITDPYNPMRPELPETCPASLASLICECWHTDPVRRPTFMEISTTLRYVKGLLMLTGDGQLQPWMEIKLQSLMESSPFRTLMVQGKHRLMSITRGQVPTASSSSNIGRPASLMYTTFDGSSWTFAARLPHGMASPNGMSLAIHHGILVGVHRAVHSQTLYWNTYTGSLWTRAQDIKSQTSPSRPAVATFQNRLFCVYRSEGNQIWCTSAGPILNSGWTPAVNVGRSFRTSDGPALASFGDRLICVIRGVNDTIFWDSFNGSAWRGYERLKGSTSGSPALAVYKNELYCCVLGTEKGLYWGKFSGSKWSSFFQVDNQFRGLFSGPSLAAFDNQLVCTLRGPGDQLYYTTFDGLRWSEVSKVLYQYCQGEQGLCAIHSKLFCVYGAS